jgi:hypothetical protein
MALGDDLERAARAASGYGEVTAVLAAEPAASRREYLVALDGDAGPRWLVLDAGLEPVVDREAVRQAASIVALCEVAGELAAGGRLEELRLRLAELRSEQPAGLEDAEQAALALERAVGVPPVVASPGYLDRVGAATRRLEEALGDQSSPFANALAAASGTVEAFVADVEGRQAVPLR